MVWGQTRSLVLLLIMHGVSCRDLSCSNEICPCGESVTITYDLNDKFVNISVKNEDTNDTFLQSDFFAKKKPDGKISIEWTDYKVMVTISEVKFSDIHKYVLRLYADSGFKSQYIDFKVSDTGVSVLKHENPKSSPQIYSNSPSTKTGAGGSTDGTIGATYLRNNDLWNTLCMEKESGRVRRKDTGLRTSEILYGPMKRGLNLGEETFIGI
ncbi:unnamed protein product [Ranitomeya imitator]|uniref:Uncharacterized protein n=1 Tax=Ranitomeya imitator TaxID=111125 RepID=A0ABN9M4I5_9NEOB|nr:unnamed protein product [Ranitomeya imitator]